VAHSNETLSSFIDGEELSSKSILDQLAQEPELAKTFERYHTIGDAMRDEVSPAFSLDFADKVAAAIDAEPTIIAPAQISEPHTNKTAKPKTAEVIPFFGKLGQYGIAASVAAAMVIGVQQLNNSAVDGQQDFPVLQTIPTGGYASPVSFQAAPQNELRQELKQQRIEQQRRMNAYIKDHLLQQRLKSQNEVQQPQ